MTEHIPIVGGRDPERRVAREMIEKIREQDLIPYDLEKKKTPEDLRLIEIANTYLEELFSAFGLAYARVAPERIHLLNDEAFEKKFPQWRGHGEHIIMSNNAVVNIDETARYADRHGVDARIYKLTTILHEMTHIVGHQKFLLTPEEGQLTLNTYRSGYALVSTDNPPLDGFNEGIVDGIVRYCILQHDQELKIEFGPDVRNIDKQNWFNYEYQMRIIAHVISKIAEIKKQDSLSVRDRFFRGYLTGEMMHLRDLEQAYGKSALRVFAQMRANRDSDGQEVNNQIARFIKAQSQDERDGIAEALLGDS